MVVGFLDNFFFKSIDFVLCVCQQDALLSNKNLIYYFLAPLYTQSTFLIQISASTMTHMYQPLIKYSVSKRASC